MSLESQVNELNELLSNMPAEEILRYFHDKFPRKVAFSSSMGAEDQVITHMLAGARSETNIFTLDTGRMFAETYELIEKTQARYKIPIKIFFPESKQVEEMVNAKGINLFYESIENRKLCCNIRKIQPLARALKGSDVWITGLRSQQSPTRTRLSVVEYHENYNMIKVNPLLNWSEEQMWSYIRQNKIPYNALHDKKFASIGCQPCTRAIMQGEDIRAGRWWWENPETKECGLHSR